MLPFFSTCQVRVSRFLDSRPRLLLCQLRMLWCTPGPELDPNFILPDRMSERQSDRMSEYIYIEYYRILNNIYARKSEHIYIYIYAGPYYFQMIWQKLGQNNLPCLGSLQVKKICCFLHCFPMISQCLHLWAFGLRRRETGDGHAANAARGLAVFLYELSPFQQLIIIILDIHCYHIIIRNS